MNAYNKNFNSLPTEIIRKVLCYTSSNDLFHMKSVCSFWNKVIQDILNIQEIPVPAHEQSLIDLLSSGAVLKVYQTPQSVQNLVDCKIIQDRIDRRVRGMATVSFDCVVENLQIESQRPTLDDASEISDSERAEPLWRIVFAMEFLYPGLKDFKSRILKEEEVMEHFRSKFKWRVYMTEGTHDNVTYGIIAEYPDLRTFAILHGIDLETFSRR